MAGKKMISHNQERPTDQLLKGPGILVGSRNDGDPKITIEDTLNYNIIEVLNDMGKVTLVIEDTCIMINSRAALSIHPMGNRSFQIRKSKE